MGALPPPDYDAYHALAEEHRIEWDLWVEGSRGCWWDRTAATGDPHDRCYFRNMSRGVIAREKPAAVFAAEIGALAERYRNTAVRFADSSFRARGAAAFAGALRAHRRDYRLACELRAGARPADIVELFEAGLATAHIGIEGLSTSYLPRMGKGTTTIQNLEALRTCCELGIAAPFHLIARFPGASAAEVAETARTIDDSACAYPPPGSLHDFLLVPGSTVERCPGEFGVLNIRNHADVRVVLPEGLFRELCLPNLEWDFAPGFEPVDWGPVAEAIARWNALHRRLGQERILACVDGESFLEIRDRRLGRRTVTVGNPLWRRVYLFCTETRPLRAIAERFASEVDAGRLETILGRFVAERLMFRFLALAVAWRPDAAIRRMREAGAG